MPAERRPLRRALALAAAAAALAASAACGSGDDDDGRATTAGTATAAQATTGPPAPAPGRGAESFAEVPGIVDRVGPSIVAVLVRGAAGAGEGSGVVWSADGLIVTNHHVVEGAQRIQVVFASGERAEARLRAADPQTDLAVLEVERRGLPPATFREELPEVGELAVALGNPLGFENTVTAGIVSGLHRSVPTGGTTPALVELVQTDAAISPGNSGGALVDGQGRVMGINVAYIPPDQRAVSIGFAIPAPTVRSVVTELLERGEVSHAFLGLRPEDLTPELAAQFGLEVEEGAIVVSLEPGGPAAQGGVRAGDVIVEAGGRRVERVEDLFAALRAHDPGDTITLTVVRGGERREIPVELGERP